MNEINLLTIGSAIAPISLIIVATINKLLNGGTRLSKTTAICTNIIGTLTKHELIVRTIYFDEFKLTKEDDKNFLKIKNTNNNEELLMEHKGISKDSTLKLIATAVNICRFKKVKQIEQSIINFFSRGELPPSKVLKPYKIIEKISPQKHPKLSTTVVKTDENNNIFSFTKGHPKDLLKKCTRIQTNKTKIELTPQKRRKIRKQIDKLNKKGQKVIALGYKPLPKKQQDHYSEDFTEKDMVFLGIIGITQPLNKEIIPTIKEFKDENIKIYLISSTKERKAIAIAKELEIINPQYFEAIAGPFLNDISDQKLEKMLKNKEKDYIFCELNKEEKERIIKTLKTVNKKTIITAINKTKTKLQKLIKKIRIQRRIKKNTKNYVAHAINIKITEIALIITGYITQNPLLTITTIVGLDIAINSSLELGMTINTQKTNKTSITTIIINSISLSLFSIIIIQFSETNALTNIILFLILNQILLAFNLQRKNGYLIPATIITLILGYLTFFTSIIIPTTIDILPKTQEIIMIIGFSIAILTIHTIEKYAGSKMHNHLKKKHGIAK